MDYLDKEPTINKLGKAITEMSSWNAAGSGGIPADLFHQCKSCLLIRTRVPDRIAMIIGDFAYLVLLANRLMILPRLQKLAESVYPSHNVDLDLNAPPLT